jgi:hypothetical protein
VHQIGLMCTARLIAAGRRLAAAGRISCVPSRARHPPWRAQRTTQGCAGHVSSRPVKAKPHEVADCPAAAGGRAPGGGQVNPAAGGSAGTEAGAHARRVTDRRRRRYRSPEARTSWHGRVPGPGTMTRRLAGH